MTHYRAMLQKLAGDVDDDQLHHSNHGGYEDLRLPHRSTSHSQISRSQRRQNNDEERTVEER